MLPRPRLDTSNHIHVLFLVEPHGLVLNHRVFQPLGLTREPERLDTMCMHQPPFSADQWLSNFTRTSQRQRRGLRGSMQSYVSLYISCFPSPLYVFSQWCPVCVANTPFERKALVTMPRINPFSPTPSHPNTHVRNVAHPLPPQLLPQMPTTPAHTPSPKPPNVLSQSARLPIAHDEANQPLGPTGTCRSVAAHSPPPALFDAHPHSRKRSK